jgi:hypothetical protein
MSGGTALRSAPFAARRMTDMHGMFQIEMLGQRRQIVGIMIHIVAAAGLSRAAVTAPVMGNDAEAMA